MTKIHYLAASGATSVAMMFGVALPAGAQPTETGPGDNTSNVTVNVDRSRTVNGDCSAIMEQDVDQDQNSTTVQGNEATQVDGNVQALVDENNSQTAGDNSSSQSNSSSNSQSNSQSFHADCSTTNVTNVTQAASSSQVSAPKGGVGAGEGSQATSTASVFGLAGSVLASGLGLGLRFLKRGL